MGCSMEFGIAVMTRRLQLLFVLVLIVVKRRSVHFRDQCNKLIRLASDHRLNLPRVSSGAELRFKGGRRRSSRRRLSVIAVVVIIAERRDLGA
jgi:hypothetical protein